MTRTLLAVALCWALYGHIAPVVAEDKAAQSIVDVNKIFDATTRAMRDALNSKCVSVQDQARLTAEANRAINQIDRWAFDNRKSADFQEANDRAAILRGLAGQLAAKPICPPGTAPPGPAGPGSGANPGPGEKPKYTCMTAQAQAELGGAKGNLQAKQKEDTQLREDRDKAEAKLTTAQSSIKAAQRTLADLANPKTKAEQDEKAEFQEMLKKAQDDVNDANAELADLKNKIAVIEAQIVVLFTTIDGLEKLPPCPEGGGGTGGGKQGGVDQAGAKGQGGSEECGADEKHIKELEQEIARLEKDNSRIDGQLTKLADDIKAVEANDKLEPQLRQERVAWLRQQIQDLTDRRGRNSQAIDILKKRIEAARKPCPPPGKTIGASFQGPYFGAHGSFAAGHSRWLETETNTDRFKLDGVQAGLAAGFDQAVGPVVLGAIADIAWGDIDGRTFDHCSAGCRSRISWLASLRARLGLPFTPSPEIGTLMPYVTGGLAIGRLHADVAGFPGNRSTETGWIAGVGLEGTLMTRPASGIERIGFRIEALWFDFGSPRLCSVSQCGGNAKIKANGLLLRAGIDVHL